MAVRGGPTVLFNGNHTTFLVQFGVYLLECYLQKAQIAFTMRAHAVLIAVIMYKGGGGGWRGAEEFLRGS